MPTRHDYLKPYIRASARSTGVDALLWQSRHTQSVRFDALIRLVDLHGAILLDAGCGHADLAHHLRRRGIVLEHYTGLEAVAAIAAVARERLPGKCMIVEGDFVRDPGRLLVGADWVYFGGSLNTLGDDDFFRCVELGFVAAARGVALSFLCSGRRADGRITFAREREAVLRFARALSPRVRMLDDYLEGDASLAIVHPGA